MFNFMMLFILKNYIWKNKLELLNMKKCILQGVSGVGRSRSYNPLRHCSTLKIVLKFQSLNMLFSEYIFNSLLLV